MGKPLLFIADYDEEGVWFYQAYNNEIADWAISTNGQFGGPLFNSTRMTWIKPSFAWVLYRSGYACKHNQERVLKIKLSHAIVAELLSECSIGHGGGGTWGRIQWDPARDLMSAEGSKTNRLPRKMLYERAIQIGLKGRLSVKYVDSVLNIVDVTDLSHAVKAAHHSNDVEAAMSELLPQLPQERIYIPPLMSKKELARLGLIDGETARKHRSIGKGKAEKF